MNVSISGTLPVNIFLNLLNCTCYYFYYCQEYVSLEFEILKFPLNDLYRVGSHFRQIHLASGSNSEKLINSFWQYIS